ncbi:resuscitation-promoting factor Rpf [Micrococcus sp.]|uniref:resuscitation-promoting factor Rpf n=1 Tax=Micrococcus sp. TaxID=1271 RepID=UPI002A909FD0|nr:transglycosylase family protein [Micrococcus sp.]MDY6055927.1 transglycosylase family protein [Micrococcus sp.]
MALFTSSASRSRRATASMVAGMTLAGAAAVGFSAPANAASLATWDKLAQCESGGNWSINTGNGFYGGLQFHPVTWTAMGGSTPLASQASKAEQIAIAEKVLAIQGWRAWPGCSAKLGLTAADAQGTSSVAVERTATVQRQADVAAQRAAAQKAQAEQAAKQAAAEKAAAKQAAAERWAAKQAAARAAAAERAQAQRAAAAERAAVAQAQAQAQAERAAERAEAQRAAQAARVSAAEQAAAARVNAENKAALDAAADTVFVKPGDSLWSIARANNVEGGWAALYEANKHIVEDANVIYVGQELVLPQA